MHPGWRCTGLCGCCTIVVDGQAVTGCAHSVLPELAEARLLHHDTQLRPATADHLPHLHHERGLLRINGLFRHGWLIAPALVQDALHMTGLDTPAPQPVAPSEGVPT